MRTPAASCAPAPRCCMLSVARAPRPLPAATPGALLASHAARCAACARRPSLCARLAGASLRRPAIAASLCVRAPAAGPPRLPCPRRWRYLLHPRRWLARRALRGVGPPMIRSSSGRAAGRFPGRRSSLRANNIQSSLRCIQASLPLRAVRVLAHPTDHVAEGR